MASGAAGLLLVRMEPRAGGEQEFDAWYDTEHIPEKMSVPGFLAAHRGVRSNFPRYLAWYDLASTSVLESEPYLQTAGINRSAWTDRMIRTARFFERRVYEQVAPRALETNSEHGFCLLQTATGEQRQALEKKVRLISEWQGCAARLFARHDAETGELLAIYTAVSQELTDRCRSATPNGGEPYEVRRRRPAAAETPTKTSGRLVVITGGGSGIGRGAAEAFVGQGCRVVVLGRDERKLQAVVTHLGTEVTYRALDVTDAASVDRVINETVREHGAIDVLINCAGLFRQLPTGAPLTEAARIWNEVVSTNLLGSFLVSQAAAPHLGPGGRILFLSSAAAMTGGRNPGLAAYAASKAGLHGLATAMARELAARDVTVNVVALGTVRGTELFPSMGAEERMKEVAKITPVGRAGEIRDAVGSLLYLASPDAGFITGQVVHVNGGVVFGR